MRLRLTKRLSLTLLVIISLAGFMLFKADSCSSDDVGERNRQEGVEFRDNNFDRAQNAVPVRPSENFPLRDALEEFNWRLDQVNHPWYTYILGDNGNILGYYVSTTRPVNSCTFLSSTEDVQTQYDPTLVLTAPSLDGIFYGGSGASAGCDAWFFFDQATLALIEIRGVKFFTSDRPLKVEAEPILIDVAAPDTTYEE